MSTEEDNKEWYSAGIKNLSKNNKENIMELQLSNMCLHCVCSKTCNGSHDKEDILYMNPREIPYCFKSFCKDPRKNCVEINEKIEELINDPSSILHKPNYPIVNTCVHNHIQKSCSNCCEGRTSTFKIGSNEFRYCWSKQMPGKNTIPIGIHWDVKMRIVNDKIDYYEIKPFSKDFTLKEPIKSYESNESLRSCLTIDTKASIKSGSNAWTETPSMLSSRSKQDSSSEKFLLIKENELLEKEIKLLEKDHNQQMNDITFKYDELSKRYETLYQENSSIRRKLGNSKKDIMEEMKKNCETIEQTVVQQFLDSYY